MKRQNAKFVIGGDLVTLDMIANVEHPEIIFRHEMLMLERAAFIAGARFFDDSVYRQLTAIEVDVDIRLTGAGHVSDNLIFVILFDDVDVRSHGLAILCRIFRNLGFFFF